jgi:hypothetical protein
MNKVLNAFFNPNRQEVAMQKTVVTRKIKILIVLCLTLPIVFFIAGRVLPKPSASAKEQVKAGVPFVVRAPMANGQVSYVRIEGAFEVAARHVPTKSQRWRGPIMDIPPVLRTQLIDLQTAWCAQLPEWTVDRQQPYYEVAMLCPGSSWKTYQVFIPPDQLPAALTSLFALVPPFDP